MTASNGMAGVVAPLTQESERDEVRDALIENSSAEFDLNRSPAVLGPATESPVPEARLVKDDLKDETPLRILEIE